MTMEIVNTLHALHLKHDQQSIQILLIFLRKLFFFRLAFLVEFNLTKIVEKYETHET